MQQNSAIVGKLPPHITLGLMIDSHGAWVITRALIATLIRRRKIRPIPAHMSGHLRRDVGLEEHHAPPPWPERPMM